VFFSKRKPHGRDPLKSVPKSRHHSSSEGRKSFRPQVEGLEDRLVPSSTPTYFPPPPPGPATSLEVIVPPETRVGVAASVEVIALSASNEKATSYAGIIHFSSTDSGATLPPNFTFTAQDHGEATFKTTFATLGSQTLTATDTTTASITGSAVTMVNAAPVATHFLVVAPGRTETGQQITITVTAFDSSNHKVENYSGTVHIASTDTAATLPANATLTNGVGTFSLVLNTTGTQTVTATDTTTASIHGTSIIQVSAPGVAVQFAVSAPSYVKNGSAFKVYVTALDADNKVATSYSGTVHISSSDTAATLPANSTLSGGKGTFSVTLNTNGPQTITATDITNSSLTGTVGVNVISSKYHGYGDGYGQDNWSGPAQSLPATSLQVIVTPVTQVGVPATVEVIALTASNQRAKNFTGVIHFTSTDSGATLPADFTFSPDDHGVEYFKATLAALGSQTITATDTSAPTITGSAATMVRPAPVVTHFLVVAPGQAATGVNTTITVTALDSSNHKVQNYTGTVHLTSTDTAAGLPANATLTHGKGTFSLTLNTVGTQAVSATDTTTSSIHGSAKIQVSAPGVAVRFVVVAECNAKNGSSFQLDVYALDASNKLATSYGGTIHFSSSDTAATLPGNSTLTGGKGKFSVTLATNGEQTVTVTDTTNPSLTGTVTVYVSSGHHRGSYGHDD
jgi:hypothetical protein